MNCTGGDESYTKPGVDSCIYSYDLDLTQTILSHAKKTDISLWETINLNPNKLDPNELDPTEHLNSLNQRYFASKKKRPARALPY